MEAPTLETERLLLRQARLSDLDAFAAMNDDPEYMTFLGPGKPIDRKESWRVLAILAGHWALKGYGLWMVEEKTSGAFVGLVGLWEPEGWPGIEVGWGIAPEHQGKGYATESARATMKWAFDNLPIDQLISLIHADNIASKKVAEKVGETYSHSQEVEGKALDVFRVGKDEFMQGLYKQINK